MTPLRQRLIEDLQLRNRSPRTIQCYVGHVAQFAAYFGRSPEDLGLEEVRRYQVFLVQEKRASWSSFNQAVCALRFLYKVTLPRDFAVAHIPFGKRPQKLPVVLSGEQVRRLLGCVENRKCRLVLLTLYAAGLRLSEGTHLTLADIDSARMLIHAGTDRRLVGGKGNKDRCVPLSPKLLEELRQYWLIRRPPQWLFPAQRSDQPLSASAVQKACQQAARAAGLSQPVSPHTLRHCYATPTHLRCVPVGSGAGPADHSEAAGSQPALDDGPLHACQRRAAGDGEESVGLAGRRERGRLEIADVIRAHAAEYRQQRGGQVSAAEEKVLRELAACRTAVLGGHVAECDQCGARQPAYNSCRNRHCPKCQAGARAQWLEARRGELLPVPYFHVVFTLPHELAPLAWANKRVVYGLLFQAASQTLLEIAADEKHLGARIGLLAVLPGTDAQRWSGARRWNTIRTCTAWCRLAACRPTARDGSPAARDFFCR